MPAALPAGQEDMQTTGWDTHRVNGQQQVSDQTLKDLGMGNLETHEILMLSVPTCTQKV